MQSDSTKKITVAAITGGINHAATRFRIRQHIPLLCGKGIEVKEYIPYWGESCGLPSPFKIVSRIPALFTSRQADIIWLCRHMVQGYPTFERLLKRPRIMDVDDAIWLCRPFGRIGIPYIARGMDAVIAGNDYLAGYFSKFCKKVFVVPTAIDIKRYTPKAKQDIENQQEFVIGWTGLAVNYRYLSIIEKTLARFLQDHPGARLLIIANRPWKFAFIPPGRMEFVPWTPQAETSALHRMSVGIMPLALDAWTQGKCSFKMLQYMATGLPVVASPVGMNKLIFSMGQPGLSAENDDQWYQALETLYKDRTKAIQMGGSGRRIVEDSFTTDIIAAKLAEIFRAFSTHA